MRRFAEIMAEVAARDAEVCRLHREGLTQTEIGRRVGLSQGVVSKAIRRERARRGDVDRDWRSAERDAAISAASREGESKSSIARRFGLSVSQIYRILRAAVAAERWATETAGRCPVSEPAAPGQRPRSSLVPTRVIGWSAFGPDVEHADPVRAAADAAPWLGGRYPRFPTVPMSLVSSTAALCLEG